MFKFHPPRNVAQWLPRLAATVFLGGVMGFVKAKSKASLIVPGHQSSLWFHMDVYLN